MASDFTPLPKNGPTHIKELYVYIRRNHRCYDMFKEWGYFYHQRGKTGRNYLFLFLKFFRGRFNRVNPTIIQAK